jgi:hypothetical protein
LPLGQQHLSGDLPQDLQTVESFCHCSEPISVFFESEPSVATIEAAHFQIVFPVARDLPSGLGQLAWWISFRRKSDEDDPI